jgi:hypothetical protein
MEFQNRPKQIIRNSSPFCFFQLDCSLGSIEPVPTAKSKRQNPSDQTDNGDDANTNRSIVESFLGHTNINRLRFPQGKSA